MFMKGGGLFSVLFMVFVGWIFIADSGETRLTRACKPIDWAGVVFESVTDLTLPQYSPNVDRWMDSAEFSCQYTIWRLFYEDKWLEATDQQKKEAEETVKPNPHGKKYHD